MDVNIRDPVGSQLIGDHAACDGLYLDGIAERPERIGQRRPESVARGSDAELPVEIFDLPAAFDRVFHQVERGAAGIFEVGVRLPQPRELCTAGAESAHTPVQRCLCPSQGVPSRYFAR